MWGKGCLLTWCIQNLDVQQRRFWGVRQWSVDVNGVRVLHGTCFIFFLLYKRTHTAPPTDRSTYFVENAAVSISNNRCLFKSKGIPSCADTQKVQKEHLDFGASKNRQTKVHKSTPNLHKNIPNATHALSH